MKENHIIYIPGLNDQHIVNRNINKLIPLLWKFYGLNGHLLTPHWEEGNSFKPKLKKIIDIISF